VAKPFPTDNDNCTCSLIHQSQDQVLNGMQSCSGIFPAIVGIGRIQVHNHQKKCYTETETQARPECLLLFLDYLDAIHMMRKLLHASRGSLVSTSISIFWARSISFLYFLHQYANIVFGQTCDHLYYTLIQRRSSTQSVCTCRAERY
jgi:hypothetical protein